MVATAVVRKTQQWMIADVAIVWLESFALTILTTMHVSESSSAAEHLSKHRNFLSLVLEVGSLRACVCAYAYGMPLYVLWWSSRILHAEHLRATLLGVRFSESNY